MLRILATYYVDVSASLPPDALASIAQLLDTTPDFHPSDLLPYHSLTPRCALDLQLLYCLHNRWSRCLVGDCVLACLAAALSFRG
jgi:hypothetical protein